MKSSQQWATEVNMHRAGTLFFVLPCEVSMYDDDTLFYLTIIMWEIVKWKSRSCSKHGLPALPINFCLLFNDQRRVEKLRWMPAEGRPIWFQSANTDSVIVTIKDTYWARLLRIFEWQQEITFTHVFCFIWCVFLMVGCEGAKKKFHCGCWNHLIMLKRKIFIHHSRER